MGPNQWAVARSFSKDVMFKKIDFKIPAFDFEKLKGRPVSSYSSPNKGPVITYYKINDPEYFQGLLPERMFYRVEPDQIQLTEIVGDGDIPPHFDHDIRTTANYYIETNNSTTYFYNKKPGVVPQNYPGKKTDNIFTFDDVEQVDEFTANDGDLYILDVSKIHSVHSPVWGIRRFISFQWAIIPYVLIRDTTM